MTEMRRENQVALWERLLKARQSGELPKEITVDDYTRYLSTIIAGLFSSVALSLFHLLSPGKGRRKTSGQTRNSEGEENHGTFSASSALSAF